MLHCSRALHKINKISQKANWNGQPDGWIGPGPGIYKGDTLTKNRTHTSTHKINKVIFFQSWFPYYLKAFPHFFFFDRGFPKLSQTNCQPAGGGEGAIGQSRIKIVISPQQIVGLTSNKAVN